MILWILAVLITQGPLGDRIDIGDESTLFIPAGITFDQGRVNILVHLHGASGVVEGAFVGAGWRGVLIEFNRKGLSSAYSKPFSDPALFPRLLENGLAALKDKKLVVDPKLGKVVLSTFSAGFGGAREILKTPANFERLDTLILADSLYCGYVGDIKDHQVDPALMEGFVKFAKQAAEGKKTMVVTHSAQVPDGYASTTETAQYLIKAVGADEIVPNEDARTRYQLDTDGKLTNLARIEKFLVLGYAGEGPDDHMRHLRKIWAIWKIATREFP